jgi:hypothetical protein
VWWAESATSAHSRISLRLYRPNGTTNASNHANSVWQKITETSGQFGNWKLSVEGENVTGARFVSVGFAWL